VVTGGAAGQSVIPSDDATAPLFPDSNDSGSGIRDKLGAVYDPAIHATGSDGGPVYRADGSFRKRRNAGAGGAQAAASVGDSLTTPITTVALPIIPDYRMVARVMMGLGNAFLATVLGPEESRLNPAEEKMLIDAWELTCQEMGLVRLPWYVVLPASYAAIIVARLDRPRTQMVVGALWCKLTGTKPKPTPTPVTRRE
jgi:hypothetical protein